MAINVNNNANKAQVESQKAAQQQQVQQRTTQQPQVNQQQSAARGDSVSLTPQAQQMNSLQKKAANASGVDSNKIANIKKAISDGSYKVDADRLASKMSHHEANLFGLK